MTRAPLPETGNFGPPPVSLPPPHPHPGFPPLADILSRPGGRRTRDGRGKCHLARGRKVFRSIARFIAHGAKAAGCVYTKRVGRAGVEEEGRKGGKGGKEWRGTEKGEGRGGMVDTHRQTEIQRGTKTGLLSSFFVLLLLFFFFSSFSTPLLRTARRPSATAAAPTPASPTDGRGAGGRRRARRGRVKGLE
ncbi:hypothetical protein FaHV1S18_103 [Falconid herpesvirus 1]|uniref:Uncharacterized protein n=2 Tax=Columbid alphaherpesvirus 1 TaxID=93386 RepID=A0A068EPQ9_9ALPH|nr:hypothetical protein FaHV1S18_103 [Falconid herpesvirus 1]YP_009352997.1 hypothetical protein CoHVHLJ_103 [Columbid alphaherpesvirus 1]AID52793.1 hypothetical protein FaHV1S18_103 [Falconid herpesvirus 1]ARD71414.1 hypothetical protein CoHVHLJ_103 [Columbid alphaherpesvirus 1]